MVTGGRVHSGFKGALGEVWGMLLPEIEALHEQGLKIWLAGHSLGAALATLAVDRLAHVQGLYTFGSPRVGDREFAARFRVPSFRLVNGRDFAARMPLKGPFRHVGTPRSIDTPTESVQDATGPAACRGEGAPAAARYDTAELIPNAIRDHVPLLSCHSSLERAGGFRSAALICRRPPPALVNKPRGGTKPGALAKLRRLPW